MNDQVPHPYKTTEKIIDTHLFIWSLNKPCSEQINPSHSHIRATNYINTTVT
jgi:hypothetical protein